MSATDIVESAAWSDTVYAWQDGDVLDGGPDSTEVLPIKQLANRTQWLRGLIVGICAAEGVSPNNAQVSQLLLALDKRYFRNANFDGAVQPKDNTLTALAALNTTADKLIYATGADQFALTPLTSFIRTFLDDADAAAARDTLGAFAKSGGTLTGALYADGGAGAGTGIKGDADQDTGWEWPSDGVLQAIVNAVKRIELNAVSGATSLWTHNGYKLVLQSDGNLVWYNASNVVIWSAVGSAPLASPVLTGTPTAPTAATGTRSAQLATTAFVGAESQIAAPVGSVYTFAGATVPTGWLKCNGALLSRTTYAALFAVIGTTYGAGDGSTTFALPDLRGEFVRGFDDARGVDSGRALGSKQGDAIRNLSGEVRFQTVDGNDQLIWLSSGVFSHGADAVLGGHNQIASVASGSWEQVLSFSADKVVPTAAENRPRNVAMHYIIKY